jgi:hypothetical protein
MAFKDLTSSNKLMISKITKWLILLLVFLLIFATPLVLNKDISPIDDSSMILPAVSVSPSENSFYDLNKMSEITIPVSMTKNGNRLKDFLTSDTWDDAEVGALLSDNKIALEYFTDASQKPKFQSPATADPKDMSQEIIAMNTWRQAAQLNCIRAIWLAKNGKGEEALAESLKVMAVGDAIEKSQTNLITYLVGLAMKENAIDTLQKILTITVINDSLRQNYQEKIANYDLSNNVSPWKFEYLVRKHSIEEIATGNYDISDVSIPKYTSLETNYYFKPNLSVKELFAYYSDLIDASQDPCLKRKTLGESESSSELKLKLLFTENAVSKILINSSDVAFQGSLDSKCRIKNKYSELLTAFSK